MKATSFLLLMVIVLATSACGGIKTYTDYDETLDLANFRQFSFYDDMKTDMEELDEKRFTDALTEELIDKGFQESDQPQFRVYFYSENYQKKNRHNIGVSLGTYGRNVSGRVGSGIPITRTENRQVITVEFADAKTNELFWQGVTEANIDRTSNPEQKRALYRKMVKKLLKVYPPKVK